MTKENFFVFIYRKAIGDDIATVRDVMKKHKAGEQIIDPEKKRLLIQAIKDAPRTLFTESWYWVLAVIFALAMGYLVGIYQGEIECNNFIIEEFEECMNPLGKISPSIPVLPGNVSYEYSDSDDYPINNIPDD